MPARGCCRTAEAYGLLECGHAFSADKISLKTESSAAAEIYKTFLSELIPDEVDEKRSSGGVITVEVTASAAREQILEHFGHALAEPFLRLNHSNLECGECTAAYLRGAFLSCGAITNPSAGYHLEFNLPYIHLSRDILALMAEANLPARLARRKAGNVIYCKESERIEDFLTMTGAVRASLEIMNVKIIKDIRNTANRVTNCENANIDKTVTASVDQVTAIRRLEERGVLETMSDDLRAVADLRTENPELSLRELGQLLEPPLSRSGVNHRIKKIMEMVE